MINDAVMILQCNVMRLLKITESLLYLCIVFFYMAIKKRKKEQRNLSSMGIELGTL